MTKISKNIELSIIIVNYKTSEFVVKCINSIYKYTKNILFEILVIDNNSNDYSKKPICAIKKPVIWIELEQNFGFGKANNIGIMHAKGKYILLLNSDTQVVDNAIEDCLRRFINYEKNNIKGIYSCQLINTDKNPQNQAFNSIPTFKKLWHENPFYLFFNKKQFEKNKETEIKNELSNQLHFNHPLWMSGAFLLFNKNLTNNIEYIFDEHFFMYFEDIELFLRLKKIGYIAIFDPKNTIIHVGGGSFIKNKKRFSQIMISKLLFVRKHYGFVFYIFYLSLMVINMALDEILFIKKQTYEGKMAKEKRIWTLNILKSYWMKILFYSKHNQATFKYNA